MKKILLAAAILLMGLTKARADYDVWLTTNITTNVTLTTITATIPTTSSQGLLHSVVISSSCAAGLMTLYDSRGSTTSRQWTTIGPISANAPYQYFYDIAFSSGLTATTSGLGGCSMQIQYKAPAR